MFRKLLATFGVVTLSLWVNAPVYAAAIINVDQVGSDVVGTITGSINREGLTTSYSYINLATGIISGADNLNGLVGIGESFAAQHYITVAEHHDISTSPLYFQSTTDTGIHFRITEVNYSDEGALYIASNYVSNTPINSTSTWADSTISGMGLISGTYVYHLDNGDTITLNIGQAAPPDPTYSVGGSVSGLTGSGLALQNNGGDTLAVATDGPFTFATELDDLSDYLITVSTQPTGQTCDVTNGSGSIDGSDITDVSVTCVDNVVPTYSVGGSVSGLTGSGLALQNNGGDTLAVATDGPFTFATELDDLSDFLVTVSTQPTGQTCEVANGSGSIDGSDVTSIAVICEDDVAPPSEPPVPATPVPTLSNWALMALLVLLGMIAIRNRNRLY